MSLSDHLSRAAVGNSEVFDDIVVPVDDDLATRHLQRAPAESGDATMAVSWVS